MKIKFRKFTGTDREEIFERNILYNTIFFKILIARFYRFAYSSGSCPDSTILRNRKKLDECFSTPRQPVDPSPANVQTSKILPLVVRIWETARRTDGLARIAARVSGKKEGKSLGGRGRGREVEEEEGVVERKQIGGKKAKKQKKEREKERLAGSSERRARRTVRIGEITLWPEREESSSRTAK